MTVPVLSASQVSTFRDCARKFGYVYLEGRRPPPHPSAALGTAIHAELETWLTTSVLPANPSALAGVRHAPPPGIPWVEHAFTLELPSSPFRGFIDALYDLRGSDSVQPFTGDTTVIQDWKSSSDPKKWAKTPDELRTDVQSNVYASWAYAQGASRVQGRWVYLATKGMPVAYPVHLDFDRSRVDEQLGLVDESARVIQTLYRIRPKTLELPPSRANCGKFGGCAFRAECPHPIEELFSGGVETVTTNPYAAFMSDVDNRFGGAPAPVQAPPAPIMATPPAPPAPVARPPYWMPGDEMNDTQKYLAAAKAPLGMIANAAQVPPPPEVAATYSAQPAPVPTQAPAPVPAQAPTSLPPGYAFASPADALRPSDRHGLVPDRPPVEAGFINPPESSGMVAPAQPSEMPLVPETVSADAAPLAPPDDLDAMTRDQLKPLGIALGAFDAGCRRQEPWMRDEIRKARKAGANPTVLLSVPSMPQPVPVTFTDETLQPPPAPIPPPVAQLSTPAFVNASPADALRPNDRHGMVPALIQSGPDGFDLFVNCSPKHYTGFYFTDVLKAVMPKVRELSGASDWRQVDYGKGAGVLANTVRTYLLEQRLDALVVDSRTPEGNACLSVLEELASTTIRGF